MGLQEIRAWVGKERVLVPSTYQERGQPWGRSHGTEARGTRVAAREAKGCPAQQKGEAFWGRAAWHHLSIRVLYFLAHVSFIFTISHFYHGFLPFVLRVARVPAFSWHSQPCW